MSLSRKKKKKRLSHRGKRSLMSLVLVLIFTAFGFGLFKVCSDKQAEFEAKLAELDSVKEQVHSLKTRNKKLEDKIVLLKTDVGIEEVAREKLGLVKPGEIAYAIVPPPPDRFVAQDDILRSYGKQEIKEVDKDRGTVIRILRHLFSPKRKKEQVST